MNASCQKALKLAGSLLDGPGGAEAASSFLERRLEEQSELQDSAIVWACLADLRSRLGNEIGKQEAADRAALLRDTPVRVLTFDDDDDDLDPPRLTHPNPKSPLPVPASSSPRLKSTCLPQAAAEALAHSRDLSKRCATLLEDASPLVHFAADKNKMAYSLHRSASLGRHTEHLLRHPV